LRRECWSHTLLLIAWLHASFLRWPSIQLYIHKTILNVPESRFDEVSGIIGGNDNSVRLFYGSAEENCLIHEYSRILFPLINCTIFIHNELWLKLVIIRKRHHFYSKSVLEIPFEQTFFFSLFILFEQQF
jgi:hypothetical protein